MKTKIITITAILASITLVPMTFAQETRPGPQQGRRLEAPAPAAQLLQDLTPEQRARVREFVQIRLQEQRRQLQGQMPQQDFVPQAQARGLAPQDAPARGQSRMQRPLEGSFQRECPCCRRPMPAPQGLEGPRRGQGRGFGSAPQAFRGPRPEQPERPFRGQGFNRPSRDDAQRPDAPQQFPGRGMGQRPDVGFGPRRFQDDAQAQQTPRPEQQQQDQQPRRLGRGRVLTEPESERLGQDLEYQQPRPGFRRNAQ